MSDSNESDATGHTPNKPIQLRVGERIFHTTLRTLQKSNFFAQYFDFSQSDGIHFVDASGEHFEHILNFLRSRTAPLFWNGNGFDYAAYATLRAQAIHFQVWDLVKWVDDGMYSYVIEERVNLTCLKRREISEKECLAAGPGSLSARILSVEKYEEAMCVAGPIANRNGNQRYQCPRGIAVHKKISDCGAKCKKPAIVHAAGIRISTNHRILVETHNVNVNLEALLVPLELEDNDSSNNHESKTGIIVNDKDSEEEVEFIRCGHKRKREEGLPIRQEHKKLRED